ncbi:MAG: MmcQ/YjbR family DNA-binding protein [Vicinamibacterales bacterium]
MTADNFRAIALSFDGAVEQTHMGHPDFRANGRIFATLTANEESGMVKVPAEEQVELLRLDRRTFSPASGAWGRQGCTMVRLADADVPTVRAAMTLAWELATSVPPPKRRAPKR